MSIFNSVRINRALIFPVNDPNGRPIAQYDCLIHSIHSPQACKPSSEVCKPSSEVCKPNLSDMPEEILVPILKEIDTLHTLWDVITASKRLYVVFQHYALEIIDAILERGPTSAQISNRMRAIFVVRFMLQNPAAAPEVLGCGSPTDENDMSIQWPTFSQIPGPVQTADLRKLVHLAHQIHGLAHCCLETSLERCKSLLARSETESAFLWIPRQMGHASKSQNENLARRHLKWSFKVEETTMLAIWRLQYFYQIQHAMSKTDGRDSTGLAPLLATGFLPFESLPKFFDSHVREQVLTVFSILDRLYPIPRAIARPVTAHSSRPMSRTQERNMRRCEATAHDRGPEGGVRRAEALRWLCGMRDSDEEPPNPEGERDLDLQFAWSRRHGPWKLPELRHVTRPDNGNSSWPHCAIVPAREQRPRPLVDRPNWSRTFHPLEQKDHGSGMTLDRSLNSRESGEPDISPPTHQESNKPPAWIFLKTIKHPDTTNFGNKAELKLPIPPYRELGVFLFDEQLLINLGLLPVGGLRSEHTENRVGMVGDIDKYAWQWIKLLSRVEQSKLTSEEHMEGWRDLGHGGRRFPVLGDLPMPMWVRRELEFIDHATEAHILVNYHSPGGLRPDDEVLLRGLGY